MDNATTIECLKDVFRYAIANKLCVFCGPVAFDQTCINLEIKPVANFNHTWPISIQWEGIRIIRNTQIADLTVIARPYYAVQPLTAERHKQ